MCTSSDSLPGAVHPRPRPEYPGALRAETLRALFADCADYQQREVLFGLDEKRRLSLCWLDGIVSSELVAEQILRPLTDSLRADSPENQQQSLERILSGAVYSHSAQCRESLDALVADLTHGSCALLFDGIEKAISFEVRDKGGRAVSEPSLEKSIKGAKDAFVETLRVNTGLVRRRLCTPALKLRELTVGRKSHTRLAVLYVDGVAEPETVAALCARLEALDVDGLLATGIVEESVTDAPRSPFPQLLHTERPDRFSLYLLEGRVGLLIDGLPIGLVLLPAVYIAAKLRAKKKPAGE